MIKHGTFWLGSFSFLTVVAKLCSAFNPGWHEFVNSQSEPRNLGVFFIYLFTLLGGSGGLLVLANPKQ